MGTTDSLTSFDEQNGRMSCDICMDSEPDDIGRSNFCHQNQVKEKAKIIQQKRFKSCFQSDTTTQTDGHQAVASESSIIENVSHQPTASCEIPRPTVHATKRRGRQQMHCVLALCSCLFLLVILFHILIILFNYKSEDTV